MVSFLPSFLPLLLGCAESYEPAALGWVAYLRTSSCSTTAVGGGSVARPGREGSEGREVDKVDEVVDRSIRETTDFWPRGTA